ncbi:hypothetical protein T4D_4504 [Trichinella pseudospiralis]|uniref:Uncharacterized protein n=1 Tax=Trichinella pseudospiralis TaxID=6337 RepID=A0A0V1FYT5_TRIPS|nr:hypothetical protein T4D_4504 [Trichinella pseudospiralis]
MRTTQFHRPNGMFCILEKSSPSMVEKGSTEAASSVLDFLTASSRHVVIEIDTRALVAILSPVKKLACTFE